MKKILIVLLLILTACTPINEPYPPPSEPPMLLAASRVTITTSGIIYQCSGTVGGITVNASNVTVRNCTIDGDNSNAGGIAVNGNNNQVLNNVIVNACMAGIIVKGDINLIEGNDISKSRQCAGTSGPDADGIRYFRNGNIIRGNFIHDILYSDVNTTAHIDCFQTWGGASGTIIENNVCDNATINATLSGSGANIENDTGAIFRNNYFKNSGKVIHIESSSSGTIIENNIFIGGPKNIPPPYQYGLFGSGSGEVARDNIFWQLVSQNNTPLLYGVTNAGGNIFNTSDPQMSGYCSLAYPHIGLPCDLTPTVTPASPVTSTVTPQISTETPTATRTATPRYITVNGTPVKCPCNILVP